MQDTASTRRSTGERIGPWFVLQRKNPTAPGLRFSVLLTLARRGHVTPRSIVRGPTTGQLWRYAAQVKGLSRVFGVCWHCSSGVSPDAQTCPRCRSAQEIPDDPDIFLESYASLPVMRETAANAFGEPSSQPAAELPAPAVAPAGNLPAMRTAQPEPQPQAEPTFGSRPITAATTPQSRRLPGERGRPDRRIIPPAPQTPSKTGPRGNNLPARRPQPMLPMEAGGDDGAPIMSASELAAVFQIDSTARPTGARRVGRLLWRTTRVAAVFLVVLGIGGVAVAYLRPDWAQQAREYAEPRAQGLWARAQTLWEGSANKAPTNAPTALPTRDGPSVQPPATPIEFGDGSASKNNAVTASNNVAPRPETTAVEPTRGGSTTRPSNPFPRSGANALPAAAVSPQLDGLGGSASTFTPASRPAVLAVNTGAMSSMVPPSTRPAETPQGAPLPTNVVAGNPTPAPTAQTPPPAPAPVTEKPARREPTLDEAITQADALRMDALDAEARRDWKAAVMIYEQIMRLPEAARPSDLKPRLEIARQNLAK